MSKDHGEEAESMPDHHRAVAGLTAVYEHTEDGWWVVSVSEIPGAHSQGETFEEAQGNIKDAVQLLLEVRREDSEEYTEGREVRRESLTL